MRNLCTKACSQISWTQQEPIVWFTPSTSTQLMLPLSQTCTIKQYVNILLTGLEYEQMFCFSAVPSIRLERRQEPVALRHPVWSLGMTTLEIVAENLQHFVHWVDLTCFPSMVSLNELQFMESQAQGCREDPEFHSFTEWRCVFRRVWMVVTLEVPLRTQILYRCKWERTCPK